MGQLRSTVIGRVQRARQSLGRQQGVSPATSSIVKKPATLVLANIKRGICRVTPRQLPSRGAPRHCRPAPHDRPDGTGL